MDGRVSDLAAQGQLAVIAEVCRQLHVLELPVGMKGVMFQFCSYEPVLDGLLAHASLVIEEYLE